MRLGSSSVHLYKQQNNITTKQTSNKKQTSKTLVVDLHDVISQCIIPQVLILVLIDVAVYSDGSEGDKCDGDNSQSNDGFHNLAVGIVTNNGTALHFQIYKLHHSCCKEKKNRKDKMRQLFPMPKRLYCLFPIETTSIPMSYLPCSQSKSYRIFPKTFFCFERV